MKKKRQNILKHQPISVTTTYRRRSKNGKIVIVRKIDRGKLFVESAKAGLLYNTPLGLLTLPATVEWFGKRIAGKT